MSRIERLLNLTAALLATERVLTAEELRERVPGYPEEKVAFRRQFERDKEALREMGLPLVVEHMPGDGSETQAGYRIPPDRYYLRDPGLSPDELSAIHLAVRVVQMEGIDDANAAWKLGQRPSTSASTSGAAGSVRGVGAVGSAITPGAPATGPESGRDPRAATLDAAVLPADERVTAMFAAVAEKRLVCFGYRDERREVEPAQLSFRNGHWYLVGHDRARNDQRSFRMDRVEPPIELGEQLRDLAVTRDTLRQLRSPWELGDGDPIPVSVRIDTAQAAWARAHLGEDAVQTSDANGSTFVLHVRNRDACISFVLGFLDHAEIVSPPELRSEIVERLRALVAFDGGA